MDERDPESEPDGLLVWADEGLSLVRLPHRYRSEDGKYVQLRMTPKAAREFAINLLVSADVADDQAEDLQAIVDAAQDEDEGDGGGGH